VVLKCEYCGAASPHAVRAQQARSEADLAREEDEIQSAQKALDRSATTALVWSIIGLVVCCVPVPGIVAIVLGRRVRVRSAARGWVPASTASVAMALGAVNLCIFVAFFVLVAGEMRELDELKAQLHAQAEVGASAEVLAQPTACALAELRLLEDGWKKHRGNNTMAESFECDGKFEVQGDTGVLKDLSFKKNSKIRVILDACLVRGERWHIDRIVLAGTACDAPPDDNSEEQE
jgi:hypothetical protein